MFHDIFHSVGTIMCKKEFDRTLADVADAPGAAVGLFEAAGNSEMDHGIAGHPCQGIAELRCFLRFGGENAQLPVDAV